MPIPEVLKQITLTHYSLFLPNKLDGMPIKIHQVNPLDGLEGYSISADTGSATMWDDNISNVQHRKADYSSINGFSGAPIVDQQGRCVGINLGGRKSDNTENYYMPWNSGMVESMRSTKRFL